MYQSLYDLMKSQWEYWFKAIVIDSALMSFLLCEEVLLFVAHGFDWKCAVPLDFLYLAVITKSKFLKSTKDLFWYRPTQASSSTDESSPGCTPRWYVCSVKTINLEIAEKTYSQTSHLIFSTFRQARHPGEGEATSLARSWESFLFYLFIIIRWYWCQRWHHYYLLNLQMCKWSRKITNPKGNILLLHKVGFLSDNSSPSKKGSFNLKQDVFKIRTLAHCVLYWRHDSMFAGGDWSSRRAVNGQRSDLSNESRLVRKIDWFWSLVMRN